MIKYWKNPAVDAELDICSREWFKGVRPLGKKNVPPPPFRGGEKWTENGRCRSADARARNPARQLAMAKKTVSALMNVCSFMHWSVTNRQNRTPPPPLPCPALLPRSSLLLPPEEIANWRDHKCKLGEIRRAPAIAASRNNGAVFLAKILAAESEPITNAAHQSLPSRRRSRALLHARVGFFRSLFFFYFSLHCPTFGNIAPDSARSEREIDTRAIGMTDVCRKKKYVRLSRRLGSWSDILDPRELTSGSLDSWALKILCSYV